MNPSVTPTNPSVTPTNEQVQEWVPMPTVLTDLVYGYLGRPFITTWQVPTAGSLYIPLPRYTPSRDVYKVPEPLVYDFVVDWGDGSSSCPITADNQPEATHIYQTAGQYTVHITGTITGIECGRYNFGAELTCISQWGCLCLYSGHGAFAGCEYLRTITASDFPKLEKATDLSNMFYGCTNFDGKGLDRWATGNVRDMRDMFSGCTKFNGDLSRWATGNVIKMSDMFYGCTEFNGDLSRWATGNVRDMRDMFRGCTKFNGDLSRWATDNVRDMCRMFLGCTEFNGDLSRWETHNADMFGMFLECTKFNRVSHMFSFSKKRKYCD